VVGRHIENFLLQYFGAILADLCKLRSSDVESHANSGHVSKTAIFNTQHCNSGLKIIKSQAPVIRFPKLVMQMWISMPRMVSWWIIEVCTQVGNRIPHSIGNLIVIYLGARLADSPEIYVKDAESHVDMLW